MGKMTALNNLHATNIKTFGRFSGRNVQQYFQTEMCSDDTIKVSLISLKKKTFDAVKIFGTLLRMFLKALKTGQ